jgi:hypothetical protein
VHRAGIFVAYQLQGHMFVLLGLAFSFWIPQIVHSIVHDARSPLQPSFIIGTSATRLMLPLYLFACPHNVLRIPPNPWLCGGLIGWLAAQAAVLLVQHRWGARCFVPASWLPPKYDYFRPALPRHSNAPADAEVDDSIGGGGGGAAKGRCGRCPTCEGAALAAALAASAPSSAPAGAGGGACCCGSGGACACTCGRGALGAAGDLASPRAGCALPAGFAAAAADTPRRGMRLGAALSSRCLPRPGGATTSSSSSTGSSLGASSSTVINPLALAQRMQRRPSSGSCLGVGGGSVSVGDASASSSSRSSSPASFTGPLAPQPLPVPVPATLALAPSLALPAGASCACTCASRAGAGGACAGGGASSSAAPHHQLPARPCAAGGGRAAAASEEEGEDATTECVICMSIVDVVNPRARMVTPCGHFFHEQCLTRWLDVKCECPTCRCPLPPV